jgi:1-deoxy-D-xylulose-5-phosphate synthase
MAYLRHIPNMIVMAPKDENELRHMLYTALLFPGPAAVRYPRGNGYGVPLDEEFRRLEIGQGEVILEGRDIALLAIGRMVYPAIEAARILREEGLDVGVINARYVKPLDQSLILETVERYKGLVTVEDGCLTGGFGSAVLEFLESQDLLGTPVRRLGLPDHYIEHGSQKELWRLCGLDAEGIADAVRTLVRKTVSSLPYHARP